MLLHTGVMPAVMFIFYIMFFTVSVWNIVTSIFVDRAMKLAKPDLLEMVWDQQKQDLADAYQLEMMCRDVVDVDGGGRISRDELSNLMSKPKVKTYFVSRGLDIGDTNVF